MKILKISLRLTIKALAGSQITSPLCLRYQLWTTSVDLQPTTSAENNQPIIYNLIYFNMLFADSFYQLYKVLKTGASIMSGGVMGATNLPKFWLSFHKNSLRLQLVLQNLSSLPLWTGKKRNFFLEIPWIKKRNLDNIKKNTDLYYQNEILANWVYLNNPETVCSSSDKINTYWGYVSARKILN